MNMRLSEYAKTPVPRVELWVSLVVAVLIVAGVCLDVAKAWHIPDISTWLWCGGLMILWAVAGLHLARYGRAVFPWQRVAVITAYTVFAVRHLWPHTQSLVSKVLDGSNVVAIAVLMIFSLSQFFIFGKRHDDDASADPAV